MRPRTAATALALIFIAQAGLTLASFRSTDDITNDRPVLNVDFCSQYYWANAAREFSAKSGKMWGYDPYFMAGYPLDFVFNSALPVQIAGVALRTIPLARVVKACFILSFALVPLTLYFAIRQFGPGRGAALAAAALGTVHFWLGENAFFGHMGMISGAFLLHFFLLPLGLMLRFLRFRQNQAYTLLFFAVALALTIHKTAFVLVLPVMLLWMAEYVARLKGREWIMLLGVVAFAVLFNLHWLYPFFRFLPLKIEDPGTTFFQNLDALKMAKDLVPLPPFQPYYALPIARIIIVGFGIVGLFRMRGESPPLALPLIIGILFFGLLSYFGSFSPPLRHLQPYRYVTAYFCMWLPAAGAGMELFQRRVSGTRVARAAGPVILAATLVALMLLPSLRFYSLVAPLRTDLDQDSSGLVEWVRGNTDAGARLMMEDINVWEGKNSTVYGGARLVQMMPLLTGRETIGGPLPNAFILHHYASFHDGIFLDRPIEEFSDSELDRAMDLYNIGWAACWSEPAIERMSKYPGAKDVANFGPIKVFTMEREHDFFLEGTGRIKARLDRIELDGLVTDAGRVVVSYHWVEGLRSASPAELVRVELGDDPVGFIGINNPPASVVISLAR